RCNREGSQPDLGWRLVAARWNALPVCKGVLMIPLEDMRALVRRGLGGLDEMDMPNAEADRLLNMSLWELESKFPFKEKECLTRTPLIAGVGEYMLPNNLDALITVSIVRGRLEGEDLAASNQPPVRYKL